MRQTQVRLAAIVMLMMCTGALGHDFWVQPSSFRPAIGSLVKLAVRVGDSYPGDPVPRDSTRIETFCVVGPDTDGQQRAVVGRDGADPAGLVRFTKPGLYAVGYRSKPATVTLDAEKFEKYLTDKGLETIRAARAEAGTRSEPGREMYSRCAKSMLAVGGVGGDATGSFERPLGLRLELIPGANPFTAVSGDELEFRLLMDGKPCADVLVVASSPTHSDATAKARTDDDGRVRLRLAGDGMWVLCAVQMLPAPAGSDADWESLWASLTFELGVAAGDTVSSK